MIRAMIFDLDGTLVKTERLKAISYARAAMELCPNRFDETEVIEVFKEVVGRSRDEVAVTLMERFGLAEATGVRMAEFGVTSPWQAFVQIRMRHYREMLADPEVLRTNQWPHNVSLLQMARQTGCKTALATMSHGEEVRRILEVLGLQDAFDFIASRDDVEHGKPHPEVYQLVARALKVSPVECLVIEDSPSGVLAAKAAGMNVIAVTTPFTCRHFRQVDLIDRRWIVDDPDTLPEVVELMVSDQNRTR